MPSAYLCFELPSDLISSFRLQPSSKVAILRFERGMRQGLLAWISRGSIWEYHAFGIVSYVCLDLLDSHSSPTEEVALQCRRRLPIPLSYLWCAGRLHSRARGFPTKNGLDEGTQGKATPISRGNLINQFVFSLPAYPTPRRFTNVGFESVQGQASALRSKPVCRPVPYCIRMALVDMLDAYIQIPDW